MPIKVTCQCGQALAVKDSLAGKVVKCPKCGKPLKIPAPPRQREKAKQGGDDGIGDLLDEAGLQRGVMRCPGCGKPLPENAVLCVNCGYDLRKGHRIKTRVGMEADLEEDEMANLPVHGVPQLDAAEREIARQKIQQKNLSKGVPWWVLLLALLGLVGFAVGMISLPQNRVMDTSGWVLVGAGGLCAAFFLLRLLIVAFQESFLWGVLFLIPPLQLLYIGTRWERCAGHVIYMMAGLIVAGLGWILLFFAPMLNAKKKDDQALRYAPRPAVVAAADDWCALAVMARQT